MSIASAIRCIETALQLSAHCSTGLIAKKHAFGIAKGPSGGPEILATIFLDDPFFGFWYGHILQHPKKPQVFVSQIVWTDKFINAGNVPLLFERFHYWIKDRLEYHPCAVQNADDAYVESNCIEVAASELARIISKFDVHKRAAFEGSDFESSPADVRILDVYGLVDVRNKDGDFPPVPLLMELRLVKNQG